MLETRSLSGTERRKRRSARLKSIAIVILACLLVTDDATGGADDTESPPTLEFETNPHLPMGFRQARLHDGQGPDLTVYMSDFDNSHVSKLPILIFIGQSSGQSHFMLVEDGVAVSAYGPIAANGAPRFHVVSFDARGLGFGQSGHNAGAEKSRASLSARADDVYRVLTVLAMAPQVDMRKVVLLGYSDGADVAAHVAASDERVSHVAFLAGTGLGVLHDFLLLMRRHLGEAGVSKLDSERAVERTLEQLRELFSDTENDAREFAGTPFSRWSDAVSHSSAQDLIKTRAKLFLAHGTEDRAVPIQSFDYLLLELYQAGRTDVTIRRIIGADHKFQLGQNQTGWTAFLGIVDEALQWAVDAP